MTPMDKYNQRDTLFDAEHGVLKNKRKITNPDALNLAETEALIAAYDLAATRYSEAHQFTSEDIRELHRLFLGEFFDWAGEYRDVDISSKDIRWYHAAYIPNEMKRFNKILLKNTPFSPRWAKQELLEKLAEIHGELVLIHPFRDGNGRTTRLLCDLLLLQAERKTMNMPEFYDRRPEYYQAIQQVWLEGRYEKLIAFLEPLMD